jgi:hypothetical protein
MYAITNSQSSIVKKIGNFLFFVLLLVLMLDPGGSILHMKDKVFIVFLLYNVLFFKPDFRMLIPILGVFFVLSFGFIVAIQQESPIDYDFLLGTFKGMAPLFLLLWVHHYNVLKISRAPAILTCVVILVIYGFVVSNPLIERGLFYYSKEHNEMVMLTTRNLLGVKVFGMYYRSIVSIIPVLYLVLYHTYEEHRHRFFQVLISLVLIATFFISGTRAMMLTPLFILGVVAYRSVAASRRSKYFLYPALALLLMAFFWLIFLLATQEGDKSNAIKYGHLESYADLFNSHIEYFLWGQGTATTFYSEGFQRIVPLTEWIYIDLLRNYGLFSLIVLAVYFYPLFFFFRQRNDHFTKGLAVTYLGFLLIAGTNPFLLNSQGMCVLWMMYAHVAKLRSTSSSHSPHLPHETF